MWKRPGENDPRLSLFRNRNKNRNRHPKTATARRRQVATRDNKENRGQTAAQALQTSRYDKQQQEKIACHYLVRMRSAVQIRPAAPGKPCNRNGCRVLSFFDEGVKQAAAMPVATVWLLSMLRRLRQSRTHKSLCPTLDNCASFCPRFVLLQRRPAAQVYSGSRIPAENFSAAGWIAGNACLRWLPHGLAELLACKAGRSAVR